MTGNVEQAVRASISPSQVLPTLTGRTIFTVAEYTGEHVVLLLGAKETPTKIPWPALEAIPRLLQSRGSMKIGGTYDTSAEPDTFDEHMKSYVNRVTSRWVGVVLEEAEVITIDRTPPAHIRLSPTWGTEAG